MKACQEQWFHLNLHSTNLKYPRTTNGRKRKVLIIHNVIAPYRLPLFELLNYDQNFDVEILFCSSGARLFKWDFSPRRYRFRYKVLRCLTRKVTLFNPTIIPEIAKRKPEVIIANGYVDVTMQLAFIFGKLMKIPVILWTEGIKEPRSFIGLITRPMRMFFIKKADAIIVPGKMSRDYVMSIGADGQKVFIAPNSVDNSFFIKHSAEYRANKNRLKREMRIDKPKIVLYVGQLIERKGVNYLLAAYERLKREHRGVALVIIGSGPLRNQLELVCKTNKISDVFLIESGLSLVDLIKHYAVADIFVLPTLFDVWGFVINEAMACGLPVISTVNAQAAREMIMPNRNGVVIEKVNEEQLFTALKRMIESDRLRIMGLNSLKVIKSKFDPKSTKEGFVNAIIYALSTHSRMSK